MSAERWLWRAPGFTRAPIEKERAYDGRHRMRCQHCDKVAYPDRLRAEEAARKISERTEMRAYFKPRCGWWHVARTKAARRADRERRRKVLTFSSRRR